MKWCQSARFINAYVNAVNDTVNQKLTGSAENGSTVTIYDNGNFVGSTTADASTGGWSFPIGQLPMAAQPRPMPSAG